MSTIPAFPSSVQVPGNTLRIKTATAPLRMMLYIILLLVFSQFPPPYPHFAQKHSMHIQQPPCMMQSQPHSGHFNGSSPPVVARVRTLYFLNKSILTISRKWSAVIGGLPSILAPPALSWQKLVPGPLQILAKFSGTSSPPCERLLI